MKDQKTLQYYTRGEVLNKEERARKKYRSYVERRIFHPGFFSNKNVKEEEDCQNKSIPTTIKKK
jgi:hypothetical protein